MTARRPGLAAMSPLVALGIAVALAACSTSAPSPAATVATATAATTAAAATTAPTSPPSATVASPTPVSGTAACNPASLAASITGWQGAAGNRVATVSLTNNGKATCTIHALATPQLVDANGTILLQGAPPTSPSTVTLAYYDVVTTMVSDSNYCGTTAPVGPVTVAFVFPGGEGRVVATPAPGDPLAGVPPCNGPGSPGEIEMHPFGS